MTTTTDPALLYRRQQKVLMVIERGGFGRHGCACDMCGERKATDQHEILSRGRSMNNPEARLLSYNRLVCALLCEACHKKAGNPVTATFLLARNVRMYQNHPTYKADAYNAVKQAFDAFNDARATDTMIRFPELSEIEELTQQPR